MAKGERIGIIMHGVTGRMGLNQHLIRSVLAIRQEGGVLLSNGRRVMFAPGLSKSDCTGCKMTIRRR